MVYKLKQNFSISVLVFIFVFYSAPAFSHDDASLINVTPHIRDYAMNTVKPVLDSHPKKDTISLLLQISEILIDPVIGIHTNEIEPSNYIIFDKLNKIKLGFLVTYRLSPEQKKTLKSWHFKYMQQNPADVFFAPSADEIIRTKSAFGCSHYARSFIAVVKALDLIDKPEDLRYVISSKADNYNQALEKKDGKITINGHQFVLTKIASEWIAINTSKGEWTAMPTGFSPESLNPPQNIPIRFASYPDVTFLIRKIGADYNDDCNDGSLTGLMNIYRSGNDKESTFKWEKFEDTNKKITQ
ncbi:MAG: hypothetical protein WC799_20495 [Desulfobacteraceae bacterium]